MRFADFVALTPKDGSPDITFRLVRGEDGRFIYFRDNGDIAIDFRVEEGNMFSRHPSPMLDGLLLKPVTKTTYCNENCTCIPPEVRLG